MKKEDISIVILILFISAILVLNYFGIKDNSLWKSEQEELTIAFSNIENGNYALGKEILLKYIDNDRYNKSVDFLLNYAILLKAEGNDKEAKEVLIQAYNSWPYLVFSVEVDEIFEGLF